MSSLLLFPKILWLLLAIFLLIFTGDSEFKRRVIRFAEDHFFRTSERSKLFVDICITVLRYFALSIVVYNTLVSLLEDLSLEYFEYVRLHRWLITLCILALIAVTLSYTAFHFFIVKKVVGYFRSLMAIWYPAWSRWNGFLFLYKITTPVAVILEIFPSSWELRESIRLLVRATAAVCVAMMLTYFALVGGLWWRLSSGPIEISFAKNALSEAIETSLGDGRRVDIGTVQIELGDDGRANLVLLDTVVRDGDGNKLSFTPKMQIEMEGASLLAGRMVAKSATVTNLDGVRRIDLSGRGSPSLEPARK